MPHFGSLSETELSTVDPRLVAVCREAIKYYDFSVIEGHRNEKDQNRAYAAGYSKLKWPNGNHNSYPSRAVDLAPYPVDWRESELPHVRFGILAGVMKVCADRLGIPIRWGADWNRNWDPRDESFLDWGHFELVEKEL